MVKFHDGWIEVLCERCQTLHVYEELEYIDIKNLNGFFGLVGWKNQWLKLENRYTHFCPECVERYKDKLIACQENTGLYSLAESKTLEEILAKK